MEQWIPFQEGEYLVLQAFLMTPGGLGVRVENAAIEVFSDPKGIRQVRGSGMIRPFLLVELHEEGEDVDLILDLGEDFRYRLSSPVLRAGKVFSPDVSALLQFSPSVPWTRISDADFRNLTEQMKIL